MTIQTINKHQCLDLPLNDVMQIDNGSKELSTQSRYSHFSEISSDAEQLVLQVGRNSLKKTKENPENFLFFLGKRGILLIAASTADLILSGKIARKMVGLGFCLGNFISRPAKDWFGYIGKGLGTLNARIGNIFGSENVLAEVFVPALCEEIEFRWFVHEVLLRKLPKAVLQKIAPDLTRLVDSLPARISRIAAASLFFAVCHVHALECSRGGAIPQLIGGLIYGTIYEGTGSLFIGVSMHCLYNLFI